MNHQEYVVVLLLIVGFHLLVFLVVGSLALFVIARNRRRSRQAVVRARASCDAAVKVRETMLKRLLIAERKGLLDDLFEPEGLRSYFDPSND